MRQQLPFHRAALHPGAARHADRGQDDHADDRGPDSCINQGLLVDPQDREEDGRRPDHRREVADQVVRQAVDSPRVVVELRDMRVS